MIHPGEPDLVRRLKSGMERGPQAEPWAGRMLAEALLDGGLVDVSSQLFAVDVDLDFVRSMRPVLGQFVDSRLITEAELDQFLADSDAAFQRGSAVWALTMVMASGRVPE